MGENKEDDEISLLDLFAVLLRYKVMIIVVTVVAAVFSIVFSIITIVLPPDSSPLPNEFTPVANMLINDSSSGNSGLSSLISSSGLGALASLAGVGGVGGSSHSSLALFLATSNTFLDSVVDEFDLIEKWEIEKHPRAESRKALQKVLKASYDDESGIFSISFKDTDPEFAQRVVNYAVDYMEQRFTDLGLDKSLLEKKNLEENIDASYNEIIRLQKEISKVEQSVSNVFSAASAPSIMLDASMLKLELSAQEQVYTQLKTQYEVLKISMASETPVFQVIERAEVPDRKSAPSRGKLCIIITFAAFFISIFMAFLLNAIKNIRSDPEAMAKLTAKN
ncbi:MAG: lipopolysaccharide biosynthesis protein [Treponema sp.]|nr:lipopolysaccharide biosynthesis protein [Treponema sp.]MBD5408487.1 lipopolysaccharide biosynthesis protein [Treponema sp.]MBD5411267.1 lipopolysaccharide biosynthesis protein [Treponema sp.]MDE6245928.1 lipopolysaccharide biosynthesis protein [Treponemataceae bacterium]